MSDTSEESQQNGEKEKKEVTEEVCNGSNGVETEEETVEPVKDGQDDAEESTAAGAAECEATGNGGGEATTINLDEDSNISKATSDVITVEDTGEGNVPSQTVPDVVFYDEVSEEEKQYYSANLQKAKTGLETSTVQCTACWKQVNHHVMNNIMRHPLLGVPVCRACRYFYDGDGSGEAGWDKDEHGVDLFCRWCAQGGEVVGCDCCPKVFCKRCLTRNLGRHRFKEINEAEEWKCPLCDPSQIYKERCLMLAVSQWSQEKKQRKKMNKSKKLEEKVVKRKNKQEEEKQKKFEEEASKIVNFVDETIHEAFETLNIYQKCLQDEQRRWIRVRKTMNAGNTATSVKNLRKIFAITKQNMELLDTALIQGYGEAYPDESHRKILVADLAVTGGGDITPVKPGPHRRRNKSPKKSKPSVDGDDIEVEEIVVNGEPLLSNMTADSEDEAAFDPSQLCSVEITAEQEEWDESYSPPAKRRKQQVNTPLSLSKNMFRKKKDLPKKKKKKVVPDEEIEEITLTDDEDSTGYVSQTQPQEVDIDSDVSLE